MLGLTVDKFPDSTYKVCTGGACDVSETDGNVEDAPSERGANSVTKTSMSSEDGGDPKQRYSSSSSSSDGRPKSLYWWLSKDDSESELSLSLEGELLSEETVAATLVTIALSSPLQADLLVAALAAVSVARNFCTRRLTRAFDILLIA